MTATEPTEGQLKAGAVLRQLRDKKNLSVQEVAGQMRLDPKIIEALEADNYRVIPADTYIRGYLRNYAKLLGVNSDEIIALYQREALAPPEIIPDVKHSTQVSSSDKPVKAFTYLITFILGLLLLIWWRQSDFSLINTFRVAAVQEPVVKQPAVETISTPTDTTTEILDTIPANSAATGVEMAPLPPELTTAAPVVSGTDSPLPTEVAVVAEPVGEVTASDTPAVPAAAVMASETPAVPAAAVTASETTAVPVVQTGSDMSAVPGPDTIYLKLNADCWIEIIDRFNNQVYQDLARTGEEIRLTGTAPFQVELGNAQGVILEFNNKPFDPAPVTTRGIARFTLGD